MATTQAIPVLVQRIYCNLGYWYPQNNSRRGARILRRDDYSWGGLYQAARILRMVYLDWAAYFWVARIRRSPSRISGLRIRKLNEVPRIRRIWDWRCVARKWSGF